MMKTPNQAKVARRCDNLAKATALLKKCIEDGEWKKARELSFKINNMNKSLYKLVIGLHTDHTMDWNKHDRSRYFKD